MPSSLIALGANIGDAERNVRHAIQLLNTRSSLTVKAVSSILQTEPVGGPENQPQFSNAAAVLETSASAHELVHILLDVERELGRERDVRWQARKLDLDLLLYEDEVVEQSGCIVPHPRMSFRRFVLEPAAEIAGDMLHPILGMKVSELLAAINDSTGIIAVNSHEMATAKELVRSIQAMEDFRDEQFSFATDFSQSQPKLCVAIVSAKKKDADCLQALAKKELFPDVHSPMLVVKGDDLDSAKKELVAALEAMR